MRNRECYFTVAGPYPFPTDMLRYDSCYPNDTASAQAIAQSHNSVGGEYEVNLSAAHLPMGPTDKRWASFGWHVTKVNDMDARQFYLREPA